MFDFNFTTTGGGILTMAYTDFIRWPLYKRRAIKYQNLDISIDENGLPSIRNNKEVVNPKDFDLNDNVEIYKNINLLKTLNDVEEELYRKFDDIEVKINRLENEVLLTFIEEAKQIDNELKRKILVDYITRKLTEEESESETICTTIRMIKSLSKNDIEKLSIIKSLLLNISCEYVTSNGEFVSYSSEFIPELDHDTSISKFCNLRYVFLKRLDTLGLISSSIMVTTLNAKHISACNIDYGIIYEGDDIKIRCYFLCEELKEILSVLDYAVINTKEYNKYIEGKLKIKLINSKYTS